MAFAGLVGAAPIPMEGIYGTAAPGYVGTTLVIDAADEAAGCVIQVPKTGNISHVHWRTATVTTGATLDIRLETVTSGVPSGSLAGTNTNGAQVVADGDDNVMFRTAMTSAFAATRGGLLGVVVKNPSASFGNMQIANPTTATQPVVGFPYSCLFTGTWAIQTAVSCMVVGLEYDDGTLEWMPVNFPFTLVNTYTFNSGSTPNHRAMRFRFGGPVRICGFWASIDLDNALDVLLVDDDWDGTNGDALQRVSLASTDRVGTAARAFHIIFNSDTELAANTTYRLVFKPTSGSSVSIYTYSVSDTDVWKQTSAGAEFFSSTATNPNDATDWTAVTTERPACGLYVNGLSDGAGGGTTVYNLAMQ